MSMPVLSGEVSYLLNLNAEDVRQELSGLSKQSALNYLSELLLGNGWIVSFTGSEVTRALLLSEPKNPQDILLIVKFIVQPHELTYHEAREELMHFENDLSPQFKCNQFAIIAANGISKQAEKLEKFNLLLQDWADVKNLIKRYSPKKIKEPQIQLFAHNKQTYNKVCRMMKHVKSIAVVQATGTGKSFLISKLLQDFSGENRIVMAPSHYIIDQLKEHILWDAGNIEFMTYARCMNLSQSEIAALNLKLIILDEYHRCGAEEWGRGVQNILNAFPGAFKIGTSATPVRFMDNARDMSKELFENNIAENLSLSQAIVRNILPMPKYICALYSLREERDNLEKKITKSSATEVAKKQLLKDLDAASINWELGNGVPVVIKKHLQKDMRKFIVFCIDEKHLLEMEAVVAGWFEKAVNNAPVKTYRIHESERNSAENLAAFKTADSSNAIHLLFSINMLNEGLHVSGVHGVILLRPTISPTIFYQQIGRCLKVGINYVPVIFDLVNNFKSIRAKDFLYDLEFARSAYAAERKNENLEDRCPAFTLKDELRKITDVFGEIHFRLDEWQTKFEQLVAYKQQFGHCNVGGERQTPYRSLYSWVDFQRQKYKNGLLEPDRIIKLESIGFNWKSKSDRSEDIWEENFLLLSAFREQYGHCDPHRQHPLYKFAERMRSSYYRGQMNEYRKNKLISIGFKFKREYTEGLWQKRFDELVNYKEKHGHIKLNAKSKTLTVGWSGKGETLGKTNWIAPGNKNWIVSALYGQRSQILFLRERCRN